jgi:hypothetical protein
MKNRMTPVQAGLAWGVPAGVGMAFVALLTGVVSASGALAGGLDVIFAFAFGLILVGGIAAFVQLRRIMGQLGDVAPPGWYDSPEDDGTQWFWTGTRWSDRTRPAPPRTQARRF